MLCRRLASASLIAGFLIATFAVARAAERRALLELFTSQGCSSCPAADKLLGEFAADPSLVVLSLPIDYWDYLGWKDTLASPADSARQRAYAHMRGDRQVYTPQIVVNGSTHALGSDKAAIEHAIEQTDQKSGVMSVPVSMTVGENGLNVKIELAESPYNAGEVWLCPLANAVAVAIGRGRIAATPSPITTSCAAGGSLAIGPVRRRAGISRRPRSRPTVSMPQPSWCKRARAIIRASSWARLSLRSGRRPNKKTSE